MSAQALEKQRIELLFDLTVFEPGQEWKKELPTLIDRADVFYLMWLPNAARSEQVDKEARYAVRLYNASDPPRPSIRPITLARPLPLLPDYLERFHVDSKWVASRTVHQMPLTDEIS
jgi:TIR domain